MTEEVVPHVSHMTEQILPNFIAKQAYDQKDRNITNGKQTEIRVDEGMLTIMTRWFLALFIVGIIWWFAVSGEVSWDNDSAEISYKDMTTTLVSHTLNTTMYPDGEYTHHWYGLMHQCVNKDMKPDTLATLMVTDALKTKMEMRRNRTITRKEFINCTKTNFYIPTAEQLWFQGMPDLLECDWPSKAQVDGYGNQ